MDLHLGRHVGGASSTCLLVKKGVGESGAGDVTQWSPQPSLRKISTTTGIGAINGRACPGARPSCSTRPRTP